MSRGLGRIERGVLEAIDAESGNALTVEDLCDRLYPGINRVEKKHKVSVSRALRSASQARPDLGITWQDGSGMLIVYHRCCVASYAMARLKGDMHRYYRAQRIPAWHRAREMAGLPAADQEAMLRAAVEIGGEKYSLVAPGGPWWKVVRLEIARRDGDAEIITSMEAAREREMAGLERQMRVISGALQRTART